MEVVKAGWVLRLTALVRKWKRTWLVLYKNGHLAFFESPDKNQPEEIKILPGRLSALFYNGLVANPILLPEGKTRDCLVQLVAKDGEEITLISGENVEDAIAWHSALDKHRGVVPVPASQSWKALPSVPYRTRPIQIYYGPGSVLPPSEGDMCEREQAELAASSNALSESRIIEQRNPHYFANRYQASSYFPPRTWMLGKRDGRYF